MTTPATFSTDTPAAFSETIAVSPLYHQPISDFAELDRDNLVLRLLIRQPDSNWRAWVRTAPDNEEVLTPMAFEPHPLGSTLVARVPLDAIQPHTAYVFKVQRSDQSMRWLAADGEHPRMPPQELAFKWVHEAPPDWVHEQVFYQIFPDRFRNGNESLNMADRAYRYLGHRDTRSRDWHEHPRQQDGPNEFFHGDLPGVTQSLEYLQDTLGVTALYLNPVFRSDSNHKYDTIDYYEVDPYLGGNDALVDLRKETASRGMRLMLDGVLNHTSVRHDWFLRAQAGEAPYHDYYMEAQGDYLSWKGHKSLPVLDYGNPDVVEQCYAGDESVLRHWLRKPYAIDGWRLDVIHMLGEGPGAENNAHHVSAMRQVIKSENPDAYFLGEHFFEATGWLQGDQEDAAMNYYGFMHPLWLFLANRDLNRDPGNISAGDLARWMAEARAKLPWAIARCQFNLLNSHDTPRLLTLLAGNEKRLQMAIRLQMAYLGVPCLYYGDEIGMEGGEDPDNRRPFPWQQSRWRNSVLETCRAAIQWRREYPVLVEGGLVDLYADEDCWVFVRVAPEGAALVAVNRGLSVCSPQVELTGLPGTDNEWFCETTGEQLDVNDGAEVLLSVPAESTALWFTR